MSSTIKLSRDAALKVIQYSREAFEELNGNTNVLNNNVSAHMLNLKDPVATQKYAELVMQLQNMLKQVQTTMEDVEEYCEQIIRWIDTMQEY